MQIQNQNTCRRKTTMYLHVYKKRKENAHYVTKEMSSITYWCAHFSKKTGVIYLNRFTIKTQYTEIQIVKAKKKICVFQVSRPYLCFCPTLNILLWIVSKMSNLFENGGKCIEKCNFYMKYFDKIKCYADRPCLVFFRAETWNTYIFFFFFA